MVHHWRQCKNTNLDDCRVCSQGPLFYLGTRMASYPFMLLQTGDLQVHLNTYWMQAHL